MKKRILVLIVGFLLIGINGFAADGDLIVNGNTTIGGNTTVNGNVGIGTTSPAYKLDVQGQIRATQGTAVYQIHQWCESGGALGTATTCTTIPCGDDGYGGILYFTCSGSCNRSTQDTCTNTLVGRLLAP